MHAILEFLFELTAGLGLLVNFAVIIYGAAALKGTAITRILYLIHCSFVACMSVAYISFSCELDRISMLFYDNIRARYILRYIHTDVGYMFIYVILDGLVLLLAEYLPGPNPQSFYMPLTTYITVASLPIELFNRIHRLATIWKP